jgi:FkbM family methyltransferase
MSGAAALLSVMRTAVPFSAWQTAGFVKRLGNYWRLDRSEALRIRQGQSGLLLYVTPKIKVFPPESLTTYLQWQYHGVQSNESSAEVADFLELSKDCKALVDIGAQTGFMSALFARSRAFPCHILSVEPDPQALPLLKRAIALNGGPPTDWTIAPTAISNAAGRLVMPITNQFYELTEDVSRGASVDVPATTLAELLAGLDWRPDIVKIDVESFEHEIIGSSLALIERLKPALQLEIHWQMLKDRGRNAGDFLAPLSSFGYRGIRRRYRDFDKWMRAGRSEAVSRFALSCTA